MLKHELGLLDVFSIAAGAMISSGLFVLPGIVYAKAGPAIIFSYLIAGLLMIPSLLSKSELATAMPKSGGSYFFIERSLGPLAGTIAGFANWLSIALKSTFALIGIGALASQLIPNSSEDTIKIVAIIACIVFALFNAVSVKSTGKLQVILTFGLILIIGVYIVTGYPFIDQNNYHPFAPNGVNSIFAVAGMVFVSYGGLTKVASVAGEVKNPDRNIPLGMFLAFIVVNVLYLVVIFITVGMLDPNELSGSLLPLNLGASLSMGNAGNILISIAAFLSFATTANAGILSASRSPHAMSKDGLLPAFFSKETAKTGIPYVSVSVTSLIIIAIIPTLSIENLVKTASAMLILMFIFINISVIIMRESGFQSYRPSFKSPFYPWLQIFAIVVYTLLIIDMGTTPLLITAAFVFGAILWYLGYVYRRIDRESAIVSLVKRIISKDIEIGRSGLEQELRILSLQKDGAIMDRFDHLVHDCLILDLEEQHSAKELFEEVAEAFSQKLKCDPAKIFNLLCEREKQSSTVIGPGLAIPHIIVEGENIFEIMLVRSKKGIIFSELGEPVKQVFILAGSIDQRNYHLRALMTIAHVVKEEDFSQRWAEAQNSEQLRDVVLLSERMREQKKA